MESWAWQGILTSIAAAVLLAGVAALLTWIRNSWPKYGDLARYWLTTVAALAILLFATTGYIPFAKPRPPQVTTENIERNVKAWSENLGLAFTKAPTPPDAYFSFAITTRTGTAITVARMTKDKPAYLQFATTVQFSAEHQAVMGTLTKDQADTVMQEIGLELAKTRVGATIGTMMIPQTGTGIANQTIVILQKAQPIMESSEYKFSEGIDDMEFTVSLVKQATSLAIRRMVAGRAAGTHL